MDGTAPYERSAPGPRRGIPALLSFLDHLLDWALRRLALIRAEFELFAGTALLAIGLLGFQSGKYCDGNTADYLSCTRPSTFYYYSAFDVALIVIGVFLVLSWFLSRSRRA